MGPVSASVEIDVPRPLAFAELCDLSRRPSFTDHFISDLRLTRIDPVGVGAGARFRFETPPRHLWMDTVITEVEEPQRIVEHGHGGRTNRIPSTTVWELLEGPGSLLTARVSFWTEPASHVDRAIDSIGMASVWLERGWREAMHRLRDNLEAEAGGAAPAGIAVAGGNPHATGIP
jgi:uncharacterized protein YndB with AHSA1/START domain